MSYSETVGYLYNLQKYGIKFGLENIQRLMSSLGNPHRSFHSVHVAGTNGKGSTSAIVASVLKTAGYRVGLFTSPHLVSFTERIRVDGQEIKESGVIALADEIRAVVSSFNDFSPTFFEVVTAMAMLYFQREKTDIAVLETGMGGRLDATNIIIPKVSIITDISYDHQEFLGNTLGEIAAEKAGIIKDNVPVVTAKQEHGAEEIIKTIAGKKSAPLFIYGKDFKGVLKSSDISGITLDYYDEKISLTDIFVPLAGEHQMINSSLAIKAAIIVLNNAVKQGDIFATGTRGDAASGRPDIGEIVRKGLALTSWPGRLEFIEDDPPILIDGAHNPAAAQALSCTIKKTFKDTFKKIIIILGIMGDKDIKGIMGPLLPVASDIIFTSPGYTRAASPESLSGVAGSSGFHNTHITHSVKDAIETARALSKNYRRLSGDSSLIIVTGSFYTIGEAKEVIGTKGILAKLRE